MKEQLLKSELLKLDSWYKTLKVIDEFFDNGLYSDNEELRN